MANSRTEGTFHGPAAEDGRGGVRKREGMGLASSPTHLKCLPFGGGGTADRFAAMCPGWEEHAGCTRRLLEGKE